MGLSQLPILLNDKPDQNTCVNPIVKDQREKIQHLIKKDVWHSSIEPVGVVLAFS